MEKNIWFHFNLAFESLQLDIKWRFSEQNIIERSRLATTFQQVNKCIFLHLSYLDLFVLGIVAFILRIYYKEKDRSPFFSHHLTFYCRKCLVFAGLKKSKGLNLWTSDIQSQSFRNSYMMVCNIKVKQSGISSDIEF